MCGNRSKILLVEDDGDISFALSMLLGVEGFEVVRAASVIEAYNKALANAPGLVVTDIEMPVLSGLDLIRLFKHNAALADIPIIAVSAIEQDNLKEAKALGAVAVYQKPIEYERLISTISQLIHAARVAAGSF